jgi:hypothetical protein
MGGDVMKITYSIWQGNNLLSVSNVALNINDIDELMSNLNKSEQGKRIKFSATISKIEVQA